MPIATVLVIEDDAEIRHALGTAVAGHGLFTLEAGTGAEGLAAARKTGVDLIILDLGLPDMDGRLVCSKIRTFSTVPIVVLTVRDSEAEIVALLESGADDYVTKPFGTLELVARILAQLRRSRTPTPTVKLVAADGLVVDFSRRTAIRNETAIRLTPIEWDLLTVLASDRGQVFTHQQLFKGVWNRSFGDARQYLRVHMTNLRRKLETDPSNPHLLLTEPGIGYRLLGPDAEI